MQLTSDDHDLFSQPDDIDTSAVMDIPFALPQVSQPSIEHVVNLVADAEIVMSTQDVFDALESLCTQTGCKPRTNLI